MTTQATAQGADTPEEELDLGNDMPGAGQGDAAVPGGDAAKQAASNEQASDPEGTDDGSKGGGHGIPRARLNEVNERRRLAEEQLAQRERENEELRAQLAALNTGRGGAPAAATPDAQLQPAFDPDAAEEQYAQALLDGDTKAAAALRKAINQHVEEAAFLRFEQSTRQQQSAALAEAVVTQALQHYPWLDEDAVALELIDAAVQAKAAQGVPRHAALAEAISTIAPRFAPGGIPPVRLESQAAPVDTRLERADKRGAAASLQQPAAVQAGMGNRATPPQIDTTQLTDEQLLALPKEDLQKALGY
ncbi:hypothetical protein [Acidovorax temperans]|nr:hypothetical protein [Acidovorax temperans]